MPTWDYECQMCGNRVTRSSASWADAEAESVWCESASCTPAIPGGVCRMRRLPSSANFVLKGSGFHQNDYPKKAA